ncbi:Zn-dependent hydrolase [Halopenitus persicus]|uniref:N-carbamoyl-L-amino-acid hydrolase n=1 Tax=Halopenitus persicus TaxID=1048396 RepID=A0A1H3ES72_9EURY|nr:Zn-dependent hydrolase [Halopenitus persicus]QHS17681.1 Zn-dependent hydrolase [haloarchaeon 3A1-DGR]SDX81583.1 N-carbamoyl-L-amino-acid hydrolase [Halopenitus persicus]
MDHSIEIDPDRFRRSFEEYSAIGATDNDGLHRLTLTDEDAAVRDLFVSDLESLGLEVTIDEMGNVFGRRPGTDPDADPVMIGSHLDSQPKGGRFDGQLGVLVALETMRALEDAGIETDRPVEIVNWTNEEGSRFENPLLGSSVFIGNTSLEEAYDLTDDDGIRFEDELERIGYKGDAPCEARPIHSFLELHIEQGPYLEEHGNAVGVVEGVYGMAWLQATIHGHADHAGPTPMHTRTDALTAAAKAIREVESLPLRLSEDAVATVGRIDVEPDSINVIPSRADFTIDVRSYDDDVVDRAIEEAEFEVATAADRAGGEYDFEQIWRIPHTEFSPSVADAAAAAAEAVDASYERMVSGAGHDAKYLNEITDTAMLFVPSADGNTHNEAEFTPWEDCVTGARTFAEATRRLATE